jgi:hypothetical protein
MLSNGNALRPRGTISTQAEVLGRCAEIALSSVESVEAVTKDPQILRRVAQLPEFDVSSQGSARAAPSLSRQ